MSIGNFKDTNESNEVNEVRENTDNTEKSRNQILETPDSYDDDFDKKLDANERKEESSNEGHDQSDEANGEKTSLLDKMRNLFSKKENGEESNQINETDSDDIANKNSENKRNGFIEDLRKDAPSMEEQADNAKELPSRDEYLEAREKSEQAKRDYPDLKDWELSPEQLSEVRQGQAELADRLNEGGGETIEESKDEGKVSEKNVGQNGFEITEDE